MFSFNRKLNWMGKSLLWEGTDRKACWGNNEAWPDGEHKLENKGEKSSDSDNGKGMVERGAP